VAWQLKAFRSVPGDGFTVASEHGVPWRLVTFFGRGRFVQSFGKGWTDGHFLFRFGFIRPAAIFIMAVAGDLRCSSSQTSVNKSDRLRHASCAAMMILESDGGET
jgi:hypothetical protein